MPSYLRKRGNRIILVRPARWNDAEELPPFDCLDVTEAIDHPISPHILETIITDEIRQNYSLYRSRQFCQDYADNPRMDNPFFGCCIVATEALYFLAPEDSNPRCQRAPDGDGILHWWLESYVEDDDKVIIQDATAGQFDDLTFPPPYVDGKNTTIKGWKQSPSKRTLDLIEKITLHHDANILKSKGLLKRYKSLDNSYAPPSPPGTLYDFLQ